MNYLLACYLILRFPLNFADKTTIPVLLLDEDNVLKDMTVDPNPFVKLKSAQFVDILLESIKSSEAVAIFVEDTLSTEDLSIKDKLGTPYKYMHEALKAKKVKYFPSVQNPYKLVNRIFERASYNVFKLKPGMKLKIADKNFKHIYVNFQDEVNSTRANTLRRHDMVIKEVVSVLRKTGPIIAIYTGKVNPVKVERLEYVPLKTVGEQRDISVMVLSKGAIFRFIGVYAATASRRANFDQAPLIGQETWTAKRLSTKMAYTDFELEFHFGFADKDWQLDSVALLEGGEEVGRTQMAVSVPWGYSYLCGEPLIIINRRDNSFVSISQYQIQPRIRVLGSDSGNLLFRRVGPDDDAIGPDVFGGNDTDDGVNFRTAINCGPYFSSNILATLFVTFLCLGIAMSGIIMMMSCKTNDSYEDPQGKPLVIASEAIAS